TAAFIAIAVGTLTGPAWALAAGVLAATYRPFLVYAGVLEPENLIVLCLAASITFGILARRGLRSTEREAERSIPPVVWAAASGFCRGLAAISRPQCVLLIVVWTMWIGIASPRRRFLAGVLTFLTGFVIFAGVLLMRWSQTGSLTMMDPGPVGSP